MNRPSFSVREYQPADEAGVLTLLAQALGSGRAFDRTAAFWRWKHVQNPFGPSLMMVAENGEILGLRSFMRWQFRVGAQRIKAVRAVDTATRPAYQRQGIFSTLTRVTVERARSEGVDIIFNTPNRYSLPGYLKLGWTYVGRPRLLFRILRPARIARVMLNGKRPGGDQAHILGAPLAPVLALFSRPEALGSLLEENDRLCGNAIRTARDVAFIRWRYADAPSLRYYACCLGDDPSGAVAIIRPNWRRGLREIMLCELLFGEAGASKVPMLVRDLAGTVDADYIVACAQQGSPHDRALRRAGFLPVPYIGSHFVVRPLAPATVHAAPASLTRWHLSLGDLEVF